MKNLILLCYLIPSFLLSEERMVESDTLNVKEIAEGNLFIFEGSVNINFGEAKINSDNLKMLTDNVPPTSNKNISDVGALNYIIAEGNVILEKENTFATGEKLMFSPKLNCVQLLGDPKIKSENISLKGDVMKFNSKISIIESLDNKQVEVILSNLDYNEMVTDSKILIKSKTLHVFEKLDHRLFRFFGSVKVTNSDLFLSSNVLEIIVQKNEVTKNDKFRISKLEAFENVIIKQNDIHSTSEKAMVFPESKKIIIEGDVKVINDKANISGTRIVYFIEEGKFLVEGDGSNKIRPKIILTKMRDII